MVWLDEGVWEDGDGVLLLTIVTKSWIVLLFSTHEKDISSIDCKNSNVSVLCSSFGRKKSVEFAIHFEFIHNYSWAVRLKVGERCKNILLMGRFFDMWLYVNQKKQRRRENGNWPLPPFLPCLPQLITEGIAKTPKPDSVACFYCEVK